ncbi:hypothetical protein CQW49_07235 [Methylosinus trichosporium OB3b]|uniref:Uncharacterized protein n=1 Tax=Methylosinus trichosporium (strain ATCC 35070 / NCIMB 11131 / UNIQEM 75 / OB3b) TaxID=595536 RepID=A0A2D2CYA5_METT3|nr:hypothetical protein CQW49_07235 [Methylosinus trichosporium OB3b]OBS51187.1 hypothetical protein A8B73_17875 [Methylosinus sp. 3S-1]
MARLPLGKNAPSEKGESLASPDFPERASLDRLALEELQDTRPTISSNCGHVPILVPRHRASLPIVTPLAPSEARPLLRD